MLLTGNDERTILLSRKLGAATEDNEKIPITVRVKEKLTLNKGGFFIYGLAAKNVLVRIYEEENVKIEPGTAPKTEKEEKTGGDSKLMIYLSLLIGIIVILIFALLALL